MENQTKKSHKLLLGFLIILAIIVGLHLFFPFFPGVAAIASGAFGFLIAGVIIFCVATLLLFIFGTMGAFVLGVILLVWTVVAIALFPIFFPILLPLFILYLFIAMLRKK